MGDLEGEVKEQPFLWLMGVAARPTVLPALAKARPSASLIAEVGVCAASC